MADYYVATTGDNGDPGTLAEPWATLVYAATQLAAGDTLYIRAGTYSESPTFAVNGTSEARITIDNYQSEAVYIDGGNTVPAAYTDYLVVVSGDYNTIRDVAINNSGGCTLLLSGDYTYAVNVTADGAKESGMVATGAYNIFDGCTMTDNGNGYNPPTQPTWGSAIGPATGGTYTTIKNCISHNNRGEGINDFGTEGCVIEDNIIYGNGALQVYIGSAYGTICRRNLIYCEPGATWQVNLGRGITISSEGGPDPAGCIIQNNLVYGCWINLDVDTDVESAVNWQILNNTFLDSQKSAQDILDGYNMGVYLRDTIESYTNCIFKNNIVVEEEADEVPINASLGGTPISGLTFDYNGWNKAVCGAATGAHDVVGDPLIAAVGSTDEGLLSPNYFAITASSPCKDVGGSVAVNHDYFKKPRPEGSGVDIGGIEIDQHSTVRMRRTEIR